MFLFHLYLLTGLITHKVIWEVLKYRQGEKDNYSAPTLSVQVLLARIVKSVILVLIIIQCFVPDVLPINTKPFMLQIIGGLIYSIGLSLAILGRLQLGNNWSDIEVGTVNQEHMVVSNGIYRYIRHPIYVGDILLLTGFELSLNSWLVLAVVLLVPVVFRRALNEEQVLGEVLPEYKQYKCRTKMFIPFLI